MKVYLAEEFTAQRENDTMGKHTLALRGAHHNISKLLVREQRAKIVCNKRQVA